MWRLFGTPVTLLPLVGGVSAMLTPLLFGMDAAVPVFLGISSVVGGSMLLALRALLGRERISRSILAEIEAERRQANEARMRALRRRLQKDGDPRTEQLLDDLLALTQVLQKDDGLLRDVNTAVASDLLAGVDALFTGCLRNLERSVELSHTLAKVSTAQARQALESDRERIIEEITASVSELSRYLSELRVLCTESAPDQELNRIRDDIDRSLKAAHQTLRETAAWEDEDPEPRQRRAAHQERLG